MLKKEKLHKLSHFQFLCCYLLCLRDICFDFPYVSFLMIWKDLRELLHVLVIFVLQQKKSSKKTKKIQSYDSKFVVKPNCTKLQQNTPNCFKIIMTSTRGNNMWPLTQNWNNDSYIQENQGVQTTCSYNLCCVSLKYGCVTCDSKGAKAATFGVNVHYSSHRIKPRSSLKSHSQWLEILWLFLSWWLNGKSWLTARCASIVISRSANICTFECLVETGTLHVGTRQNWFE